MRKSNVNKLNAIQRKPIHYAALEGHSHIVEVLLDCGSKVRVILYHLKRIAHILCAVAEGALVDKENLNQLTCVGLECGLVNASAVHNAPWSENALCTPCCKNALSIFSPELALINDRLCDG